HGKIVLTKAGEAQPAVMCEPQGDERHDGPRRYRADGVPQHFHPGVDLSYFLPPVVINNKIGSRRNRPQRSEEHTSELQSRENLVCRLLLEKKKKKKKKKK